MGSLRRLTVVLGAALLASGTVATVTAGAATFAVSGTMTGPGGFRQEGCGGVISQVGSGTYVARGLGHGTYTFDACVLSISPYDASGTVTITRSNGAQLTATIDGLEASGGPAYHASVTGGTKRYRHATGELRLGPLAEADAHNCNPRVGICLDWTDTGPLTGTLAHVRRGR